MDPETSHLEPAHKKRKIVEISPESELKTVHSGQKRIKKPKHVDENGQTKVHCAYFILKKNRSCNLEPKEGSKYCSNHLVIADGDKRIPCPLDPRQ